MIAFLVLNYNDAKTTIELVDSVKEFNVIDHVLVVDNCSTDDSFQVLSKIKSEKVEVLSSTYNGGYGAGNNFGIDYLVIKYQPDYIVLANPDIIIEEKTICEMEKFLDGHKDYVAVAPFMCNSEGEIQKNTGWNLPSKIDYVLSMGVLYSIIKKPGIIKNIEKSKRSSIDVDAISGSLYMMDANAMKKYGMYDENVFLYCEETILGFKFKSVGLKSAILTDCSYIHNHSISISKTYKSEISKRKLLLDSRHYVLKTYYKANRIELCIAHILEKISLFEMYIISKIGDL